MIALRSTVHPIGSAEASLFRAASDLSGAAPIDQYRIVGGLAVRLLQEAFPGAPSVVRPTTDVDAALSLELAASGVVHEGLAALGYENLRSTNEYLRAEFDADGTVDASADMERIELLVPHGSQRPVAMRLGTSMFTGTRSAAIALQRAPLLHEVRVEPLDQGSAAHALRVPTPDLMGMAMAKAITACSRSEHDVGQDLADLVSLLEIVHHQDADPARIGPWDPAATGLRQQLDAVPLAYRSRGSAVPRQLVGRLRTLAKELAPRPTASFLRIRPHRTAPPTDGSPAGADHHPGPQRREALPTEENAP